MPNEDIEQKKEDVVSAKETSDSGTAEKTKEVDEKAAKASSEIDDLMDIVYGVDGENGISKGEEGKDSDDEETAVSDKKKEAEANAGVPKKQDDGQQDVKRKILDDLLVRAEKVGLSKEAALSFSSPKDLDNALKLLESRQPASSSTSSKEESKKTESDQKGEDYDCGLSKDVYEDQLVDVINSLGKMVKTAVKENAELKERLKALDGIEQKIKQTELEPVEKELDNLFSSLGDDFKDQFGTGQTMKLNPTSETFRNRAEVVRHMAAIEQGYVSQGLEPPSPDELFQEAVQRVTKRQVLRKPKEGKDDDTVRRFQERASQTLGKPGGREKPLSKEAKAIGASRELDELI